jgi:hypothetical protein
MCTATISARATRPPVAHACGDVAPHVCTRLQCVGAADAQLQHLLGDVTVFRHHDADDGRRRRRRAAA